MIRSNLITDKNYYAVRPELVLAAAKLFAVTPSMLEKGAKKLYSRAVAVTTGKQDGQWGRHQKSVIEQFCSYTQMTGSYLTLPWQELVELSMNYDGKEGISSRTGNRPLSTVLRVAVDSSKLRHAREKLDLSCEDLSRLTAIPLMLLEAMESGDWPEVAISTAEKISQSVETSVADIFTSINVEDKNSKKPIDVTKTIRSNFLADKNVGNRLLIVVLVVITLLSIGFSIWKTNFESIQLTIEEVPVENRLVNVVDTLWHAKVLLNNGNIPVDQATRDQWSNGAYIILRQNNIIGFNWIDPNVLPNLPSIESNWKLENGDLVINLGSIIYRFKAPLNNRKMTTFDHNRAFKMTIHRLPNE